MRTIFKISVWTTFAISLLVTSCKQNQQKEGMENTVDTLANPLLHSSKLPYGVPDLTKISDTDFAPAFDFAIQQKLDEVEKIAGNPDEPTFDNTLVALEKCGKTLKKVNSVFDLLTGANTDSTLQALQEKVAPRLAAIDDAIYLNVNLYERFKKIYNSRASLNLDPESARLLEYYHNEFIHSGADLPDEAKSKLKKLNEEEATLSAKFTNQLLAAGKAGAFITGNEKELEGLSEGTLKAAAQDADAGGKTGQWLIPLQNTTQQPALQSMVDRNSRHKLFEASWTRAEKGDENDTRATIKRLAELRAEKAKMLGFKNFAAWNLQDQMAKTPEAVETFLARLVPPATARANKEASDLQALIDKEKGGFRLMPWDWNFYAEKVRKARYDLDESQIKPYFELFNVLENGVFYAANRLYGITLKRRNDIPVYQNDVRVYEVFDKDGSSMALFFCDYFKRDNKSGGAWMNNLVEQSKLLGTKPVIYNICNFPKPAPGEPALISWDDVTTMFHEFGHALHGLFADQTYPSLSGTNVARDFVEFPSQFNEHWALYPDVLKHFAVHYKTGKFMPQELVDKIKKSSTFNQGYRLTELLGAAELDMQWHTLPAGDSVMPVDEFESLALQKTHLDIPDVPPRYRSSYFLHIWGNGYAAGYYAYLWAEMLDDDAFAWFETHGGLTPENGQRFRDLVLSRGNTEDYNKMYSDFAGRAPDITPMLKNRGLQQTK
jgi:peptidyl-dipeptidase Dcp